MHFVAPELLSGDLKKSRAAPLDVHVPVEMTPVQTKSTPRNPPQVLKKKARTTRRRKPTTKPIYICGSCGKECKDEEDIDSDEDFTIGCDKCIKWFHWSCVGYEGEECDKWCCGDCGASE